MELDPNCRPSNERRVTVALNMPVKPNRCNKEPDGSPDGTKLHAGVGSNSNITENGIQAEVGRAALWEIDRATGAHREFATGLRNPNGLQK